MAQNGKYCFVFYLGSFRTLRKQACGSSVLVHSLDMTLLHDSVKDKSGVDKIIVKKQPYQLLNTNREFFPSFDASNFHKFVNESS